MDPRDVQSIPLFAGLSKDDQKVVAQYADEVDVDAGKVLAQEGRLAYEFFAIKRGHGGGDARRPARRRARARGTSSARSGCWRATAAWPASSRRAPMSLVVLTGSQLRAIDSRMPGVAERIRSAMAQRLAANRVTSSGLACTGWRRQPTPARGRAPGWAGWGRSCSPRPRCSPRCTRRRRSCPSSGASSRWRRRRPGSRCRWSSARWPSGRGSGGRCRTASGAGASLVLASGALVVPSLGVALAPSFGVLLAMRAAQGLCMPGLLTVGVPYVTEAYAERIGARAMGLYVSALVLGGLVGRVGVALLTAATSWRVALGAVAALPLAATLVMRRSLPPGDARARRRRACRAARCAGCSPTARSWPPASRARASSSPSWASSRTSTSASSARPSRSRRRSSGSSSCSGSWAPPGRSRAGWPTATAGGRSRSAACCCAPAG